MPYLHIATDVAIGVTYVLMSVAVVHVARSRPDLRFNRMLIAFGVLMLAGGATHLVDAAMPWQPAHWLVAGVRLVTAVAAVATACVLLPLVGRALALPSPGALNRANAELAHEVGARRAAEAKVRALLEVAPDERHGESERVDRLRAEVARAQAEEAGQRASFLAEASRVLAGSLDFDATLKSMARVAASPTTWWSTSSTPSGDCVGSGPPTPSPASKRRSRRLHPSRSSPTERALWQASSSAASRPSCARSATNGWPRGRATPTTSAPARCGRPRSCSSPCGRAGARWASSASRGRTRPGVTRSPISRSPRISPSARHWPRTTLGSTVTPRTPAAPRTSSSPCCHTSCARR